MSVKERLLGSERLVKWIKYVLYTQILIAVLAIILGLIEHHSLSSYQNGIYNSLEEAFDDIQLAITLLQGVGILSLLAFIASALLIVPWIYRANDNAHQLGAENMRFTPAWSIAYYIIPIFNLWKPYQAMKEIWITSNNPSHYRTGKVAFILPLWWGLWIISNLLGQSIFRLSATAESLPELYNLNLLSQLSNIVDIPLALVTLAMITSIQRMQCQHQ
jgi:hypothetical protein